jgi:hypothetical protein
LKFCRYPCQAGQSFTEYAILGALVLLLVMPVMFMMGQTLSGSLGNMLSAGHGRISVTVAKPATGPVESSADTVSSDISPGNVFSHQLTAIEQAALGKTLSDKVLTLGANGTTTLLASQLTALAEQLRSEGKIDEKQYNAIMDLANQGHHMAMIQMKVEDAIKASQGDPKKFKKMTIEVDGKLYNAVDAGLILGFKNVGVDKLVSEDLLNTHYEPAAELDRFISLYHQTESLGVLSDPSIKAVIDSAALQIVSIGEFVEGNTWEYSAGVLKLEKGEDINKYMADDAAFMAVDAIHSEASRICKAGDLKDSGVQCSK